jgi:hypothetical protein
MPTPEERGGDVVTISSAVISDDGLYRYRLARSWSDEPPMTFVMLNPSTADAERDDPTIRRCMGFARREGCGGITVVNLFGLRVTRPAHLTDGTIAHDPNGFGNTRAVEDALVDAHHHRSPIVVAWGAYKLVRRSSAYSALRSFELRCLGTTANGSPRHPLYVRADQPLELWGREPGR